MTKSPWRRIVKKDSTLLLCLSLSLMHGTDATGVIHNYRNQSVTASETLISSSRKTVHEDVSVFVKTSDLLGPAAPVLTWWVLLEFRRCKQGPPALD